MVGRLCAGFFESGHEEEEGESDSCLKVDAAEPMDEHHAQNDPGLLFF